MAVELRCPDCRAKLRLKAAPEAGTEVECPKCGTVFPAPEPEANEDEAPKKKKPAEESKDGEEKPKKDDSKEKKGKKAKGQKDTGAPKKRQAKKRETSKAALFGVIGTGIFLICMMTGTLIYFFTRTSKATEMMYYVPEDAQVATGFNLGHAQKYPEFYKSVSAVYKDTSIQLVGDAVAKAAGSDLDSVFDYVVTGSSTKNGSAIVFRTKSEFDDSALSKIPNSTKQTLDGKTYYLASGLVSGSANEKMRIFAPTNRLVVAVPSGTPEAAFKKILAGHADSKEKTLGVRMGELGKRVTRGTFWQLQLFSDAYKLSPPPTKPADGKGVPPAGPPGGAPGDPQGGGQGGAPAGGEEDSAAQLYRTAYEMVNGSKGFGLKASLGSREVRFEFVVWYNDNDKASDVAKKMKESELGKGDEGNPPKWFKETTQGFGDKKIAAQMLSNLGFGSSGDVFYARTAVETVDLQQSASNVMGKVTGTEKKDGQNPSGDPQGGPPQGGPPPKGPRGRPRRRRGRR